MSRNRPAHLVVIAPAARRQLRKLARATQTRLLDKIEALAEEPRPAGCKKLSDSEDIYRVRSGDYRIIYQVEDAALYVLVLKVAHRRDVYR